ncbi:pentapeptide repeat-containing protein [Streptomyces sp. NRRL S-813]|uniref:pentapeptide repeat-containing protein n=1 Tax=Streptomyces sp. NRRL S-813 TaxID=1463919 RepID=UPI0004C124FB|nr:pentapeptide repeat-containing protein [Streptomyces sp. NRRL S-813]
MGVPTLRRRAERRGLRLWPVGTVLVLSFAAAVLVAAAVFYTGWDLLGARGLKPEHRIDSKTLFDLVKLSFGVVAGAGALVALVVAYRRQRVDEDGALREATRLHTERFTTAVSQLGHDSAAVRLGGVHALAGLADDAPTRDLRQTCIDVLCAYLRLPYTSEADLPAGDAEARHAYLALREVRHTVIRLVRDHLGLDPEHPHSWQGHDFDFTGVTFDGGDFSYATFSGGTVSFRGSTFSGGEVTFYRSTFSGATVNFIETTFSGTTANFDRSRFSGGEVIFRGSTFSGGEVNFDEATFSGATVDFRGANGVPPAAVPPPEGEPLQAGLRLPPAWYPASS